MLGWRDSGWRAHRGSEPRRPQSREYPTRLALLPRLHHHLQHHVAQRRIHTEGSFESWPPPPASPLAIPLAALLVRALRLAPTPRHPGLPLLLLLLLLLPLPLPLLLLLAPVELGLLLLLEPVQDSARHAKGLRLRPSLEQSTQGDGVRARVHLHPCHLHALEERGGARLIRVGVGA